MIKLTKLNDSYSVIEGTPKTLQEIFNFLKVQRPDAYFDVLVQRGLRSPYDFYSKFLDKEKSKLQIYNGHVSFLTRFGLEIPKPEPEFSEIELDSFLESLELPFKPYDYQIKAFKSAVLAKKMLCKMCTSSGKSLTISLIAEFMRTKGRRGVLVVPNINLLAQFKSDIESYGLTELHSNTIVLGGDNTEVTDKTFNSSLLISTWQSLIKYKDQLNFDYLIGDECHRYSSEVSSSIIQESFNTEYKLGFTGTLPEDPCARMFLIGLFGLPQTFITASELISRGLGTPINIFSIILEYPETQKNILRGCRDNFQKLLKTIKSFEPRTDYICNLALGLSGNTLLLFQHTEHGKSIFIELMKSKFPDVKVENKDITGKHSFKFQKQYQIFFINGEDDTKIREQTRLILEECDNAILVANYAILSTGANIKKLHNMIFASPLKSYNTITQSIGRGMRLHESKKSFNVYDIVDNYGAYKPSGVFWKQYQHRIKMSYNPEGYPIIEKRVSLEPEW